LEKKPVKNSKTEHLFSIDKKGISEHHSLVKNYNFADLSAILQILPQPAL